MFEIPSSVDAPVIVVEAAILLEAGWGSDVGEVFLMSSLHPRFGLWSVLRILPSSD